MLVFEDVHWADNATLDLVKYLGRRVPAAAHHAGAQPAQRRDRRRSSLDRMCSATCRPDRSTAITLEPLSEARHGAGRAGRALQRRSLPHHRGQSLLRHRASGQQRRGADAGSEFRPRRGVVAAVAPSDDEREVLEVMSIVPGSVEPWLIPALLGAEAEALVDRCVARGLLRRDEQGRRWHSATSSPARRRSTGCRRRQQRALHAKVEAAMAERSGGAGERAAAAPGAPRGRRG